MEHVPTAYERQLIRDCARRMAGKRHVRLEPGYRCNEHGGMALNVATLVATDDINGTDLDDFGSWNDFVRGFELTTNGRGIVDFYVSGLGRNGELEGNVTAFWHDGKLTKITGTCCGTMYQKGEA